MKRTRARKVPGTPIRDVGTLGLLLTALIVAASLRIPLLDRAPRGMNVDEAVNAWNTWCLLHTGADQHGVRWPVLDSAGFGQGMTTLLMYVSIPFQAMGGLTPAAIRLPGALAGIATVALVFFIATRMFDARVGAVAALIIAVTPGHVQISRWGHMATLFPFAVAAVIASLIYAGLPLAIPSEQPSAMRAAIAGAVSGIVVYGYYGMRLWLPLFLVAIAILIAPQIKTVRRAALAFAVTASLVAAPLIIGTLTNAQLQKRAAVTWVWNSDDAWLTRIAKVAARYPPHFGLDYLARHGDPDPAVSPPVGFGTFLPVVVPFIAIGVFVLLWRWRHSLAARVLLVSAAMYPAADLLSEHPTTHALRSAPGLVILPIVSALGIVATFDAIRRWDRSFAMVMSLVISIWFVASVAGYTRALFTRLDTEPPKFYAYSVDLIEASKWLRPRLQAYDAVFVTGTAMSHPYVHTLVTAYPPDQWQRDVKSFMEGPLPNGVYRFEEICLRYGKMHFFFDDIGLSDLEALRRNARSDHVLLIIRPGELQWLRLAPPVFTVKDPRGVVVLECIEAVL